MSTGTTPTGVQTSTAPRTQATSGSGPTPSYWFYMQAPTANVKQLTTYCGYGYQVDYQEDDTGQKSWSDLMDAAIPAIQADIDTWGLPYS